MGRRSRFAVKPAAAALTAAMAVAAVASAPATLAGEYTIYGVGGRPCAAWLQARTQAGSEGASLQSWLLGYVTSINAHQLTVSSDVAEGTDPDGMFRWVDDYCTAHPLDSVARAAASLVGVMRSSNRAR